MNKKSKNRQAKNQQNPDKIPEFAFKFSNLFSKNYQIITTILLLFPLVIYGQVWNFEFVWDDFQRAGTGHLHNPFVKNPSFSNFFQLFSQPYFGMYIPITYLFWGGLKAFAEFFSLPVSGVLHFTNVIIHIVNGLLVFTILKNFISNKWAVLLGTLFFLLHPIQVETVAFISEFRNLLAFCFSLSGLYFYLKNQARLDFLPLFLFILALLSKPSAAVLPLIIFAIN
ncbi:MAG: hypothetical protein HAW58_01455, partial [Candidatus Thioglobus sp.]|nr:hypothetical protein [Candidatus Thioglobus sp.]